MGNASDTFFLISRSVDFLAGIVERTSSFLENLEEKRKENKGKKKKKRRKENAFPTQEQREKRKSKNREC
jgi:hypothetical protein